jgi:tRNA threonylcarbamoyladenosine biosynthesis protein TsaB
MKILAIDSATEGCSAALLFDAQLTERFEIIGRGHADRLLPMADALLIEAGLVAGDLDAVAFGRGPGGFTGVRIAAALAQGLAAGIRRPVLPISDLAALAAAGARATEAARVLACLDARMGQVYWAAYDCSDEVPAAVTAERLSVPGEVAPPGTGWFGAGHGLSAHPEIREHLGAALSGMDTSLLPRASDVARIAAREFAAGGGIAAERGLPVYLRDEVVHRR